MAGSGDEILRCPACGKEWPSSHARCPDDGATLASGTRDGVHFVDTMILAGRASSCALHGPTDGDETVIDPAREERSGGSLERPAGTKSSDPPTVLLRRSDGHIELPPGSVVDDAYEVDARLGAGAMGEVYAAHHVKLGKRVALKVISPRLSADSAAVERFAQEAQMLARMHHPGLVDVLGFGELADGRAYFVMEFLSGETLYDRLERGRLHQEEALDLFAQMARALEAAHAHGIVHRDLKPENVFLAQVTNETRPVVKLLDFGLAKLAVDIDKRTERTQSGVVIGTALYLSPEQAHGPDVDGRTDVYALGCIGYELLAGRHPFERANTVASLIAAHLHELPPRPRVIAPAISPDLDSLLFAMLSKDPAHRPTLPEVRAVIGRVSAATTDRAIDPLPKRPARAVDRRTIVFTLVVMLAGVGIGAVSRGSRSTGEIGAGTADASTAATVVAPVDAFGLSGLTVTPISPSDVSAHTVPQIETPPIHEHAPATRAGNSSPAPLVRPPTSPRPTPHKNDPSNVREMLNPNQTINPFKGSRP